MKHLLPFILISAPLFATDLIVTVPNSNIYMSPNMFYANPDNSIQISASGGYLKGCMSGSTKMLANVDTSSVDVGTAASDMPVLKTTIDDQPARIVQLPVGGTQITLASNLSTGAHRFRIEFLGGGERGDGWGPSLARTTKVQSLEFDPGTVLAAPTVAPNVMYFLGDSYLEGYFGGTQVNGGGTAFYNLVDYTFTWPKEVANALNAEWGQMDAGGTGWLQPQTSTTGGFPAMPEFYDHFDSTHRKMFRVQPNYVVVADGTNDHRGTWSAAQVQTTVQNWLIAARPKWPNAKIFLLIPPGGMPADGQNRQPIVAAVAAVADPNVYVIDPGTIYAGALAFNGPTWMSNDGIHPQPWYHGLIGAIVAAKMGAVIGAQ